MTTVTFIEAMTSLKVGQYSLGFSLFAAIFAGILYIQKRLTARSLGPDRPDSRTEFGRDFVEARRDLYNTGYQGALVKVSLWFAGLLALASAVSFMLTWISK